MYRIYWGCKQGFPGSARVEMNVSDSISGRDDVTFCLKTGCTYPAVS